MYSSTKLPAYPVHAWSSLQGSERSRRVREEEDPWEQNAESHRSERSFTTTSLTTRQAEESLLGLIVTTHAELYEGFG